MVYGSFLDLFDRLSSKSILRGSIGSIAGVVGTIAVIVLVVGVYIGPTISYLEGNYFESEFGQVGYIDKVFNSTDDIKIAVVFKEKLTGNIANHSAMLEYIQAFYAYSSITNAYLQYLEPCQPDYLSQAINPEPLAPDGCFILPSHLQVNFLFTQEYSPINLIGVQALNTPNPFDYKSNSSRLSSNQLNILNLFQKYYTVFYFTSKIIDQKGSNHFQVHQIYSTDYSITSDSPTSSFTCIYSQKTTFLDDSILPMINNKTVKNLYWRGGVTGASQNSIDAARVGSNLLLQSGNNQIVAFRYYKKLDWLLGIIGGGMFLFLLIFWVPCSYINRTLKKMRVAERFLLSKSDSMETDLIRSEDDLNALNISISFLLYHFLPACLTKKCLNTNYIERSEKQLDIVTFVKKMKLTKKNLIHRTSMEKEYKIKKLKFGNEGHIEVDNPLRETVNQNSMHENSNSMGIKLRQESRNKGIQSQGHLIEILDEQKQEHQIENQRKDELQIKMDHSSVDPQSLEVDQKFQLSNASMQYLHQEKQASEYFCNNLTALAIRKDEKRIQIISEVEKIDPFEGHIIVPASVCEKITNFVSQCLKYVDLFGAQPNLSARPHNSSMVGFFLTLIIITLSVLTFALTIANMNSLQIVINDMFADPSQLNYQLTSGQNLNILVCTNAINNYIGVGKVANFQFFLDNSVNGRQYLLPSRLSQADAKIFSNLVATLALNKLILSDCFKLQNGINIPLGILNNQPAYFGFKISAPPCLGTGISCLSNAKATLANFINSINSSKVYLYLPLNNFDTTTYNFVNLTVQQPLQSHVLSFQNRTAFEEIVSVQTAQILDDTSISFLRTDPKVVYKSITSPLNDLGNTFSRSIANTQTYYEVKIMPTNQIYTYELRKHKIDFLFGIFGGVFVFWYAVVHIFAKLYNQYKARSYLSKALYNEKSYDQNFLLKFYHAFRLSSCCLSEENKRIRAVDERAIKQLDYISLLKYVDNCYRLSSTFYSCQQTQQLSLVYFKEFIDQSANVVPLIQEAAPQTTGQLIEDYEVFDDVGINKVINQDSIKQELVHEKEPQPIQTYQQIDSNADILPKKKQSWAWLSSYDFFEENPQLTFKGQRYVKSCCGGFCSLILITLIIIVGYFQVINYLNRDGKTLSLTTTIDDNLSESQGIKLLSGTNFKFGITFGTNTLDYPQDISSFTNTNLVGISLLQYNSTKVKGVYFTDVVKTDLIPCKSDYISSWADPNINSTFYQGTTNGYCLPDGLTLSISGLPQDNTRTNFKFSIYNKAGTAAGETMLRQLLTSYNAKIYYSTPVKNSFSRIISYSMNAIYLDTNDSPVPTEHNLTLGKMILTFDDMISWVAKPITYQTYSYDAYRSKSLSYYGPANVSPWYNISFASNNLVTTYTLTAPKFHQVFGLTGGIIVFFFFIFSCCILSFNSYNMEYSIAHELYLFGKKKIKSSRKAPKSERQKESEQNRKINNYNEASILWAFILSFVGRLTSYNINDTLRRVTLLQQKLSQDLDIYECYKLLHSARDQINKKIRCANSDIKITDIYGKKIYEDSYQDYTIPHQKLSKCAKMHGLSSYEQKIVSLVVQKQDLYKQVLTNEVLLNLLGAQDLNLSHASNTSAIGSLLQQEA